uniref:Uncharacterized protein n=1 Tax=Arundo donax TaxID=35708 RepID=A0A0A8YW23_ARUDO
MSFSVFRLAELISLNCALPKMVK